MKTAGELFEDAILNWRDNKGVGTAMIPAPFNDKIMVLGVLQRIYNNKSDTDTLIITQTFQERMDIIEFITTQPNDDENNTEFKHLIQTKIIKIYTVDLINRYKGKLSPRVCILYHPEALSGIMVRLLSLVKFRLVVLNKLNLSSKDIQTIYDCAPLLDAFKQNELDEARVSTPVEDMWIGVDIPEDTEEGKLLKYYNEYIATSISIFGSFDIMQQANLGNQALNISANQICDQIARENGWDEHLDMSIELNIQLDSLYNPGSIKERAFQTYEIIRKRAQLLSDYEGKLEPILNIIKENTDSKILIINKRGDFANKVTDYINNNYIKICGNYHDKVDPVPLLDYNGKPVCYKSGPNKGKHRYLAAQGQKTLNEKRFNNNEIRVLSTTAAPDKNLNIAIDIIIITSPQCEDIKSYMYRLSNVGYNNNKIKLYNIYIKNTLEQSKLENKPKAHIHTIVNNCENSVVSENNSDFIVVD